MEREQANARAKAEIEQVSSEYVRQSSKDGAKSESERNYKRVPGHHKDSTDSDMQWALPDTHEVVQHNENAADGGDQLVRDPRMGFSPGALVHQAINVARPIAKVGAFGVGLLASVIGGKTSMDMINSAGTQGGVDDYAEEDSSLNLVRWTK
jgi:hypothetical protein